MTHQQTKRQRGRRDIKPGASLIARPDAGLKMVPLTPLCVLDELIAQGYGDTPQNKIPADWRTRKLIHKQQGREIRSEGVA